MRVVSFNIQHGLAPSGAVDIDALAAHCAGLDADVLALQEVDVGVPRSGRVDTVARVAEATGMTAAFGKAARVGVIGSYGNALLVRGTLTDVETIRLPRRSRSSEPRAATLASVTVASVRFSAAATHLSIDEHEAQAQLSAVLTALAARPGPRILLGDLNLRPEQVQPSLWTMGLALADPQTPTFPAHAPRIRIDHVATDAAITAVSVSQAAPVSDHRPLAVEVGLIQP